MESATTLTEFAVTANIRHCSSIKHIFITGNDKTKGRVTGCEVLKLLEDKRVAKKLRYLDPVDQRLDRKVLKSISEARLALAITQGNTEGDGPAARYVASLTGGEEVGTWMGGKLVG